MIGPLGDYICHEGAPFMKPQTKFIMISAPLGADGLSRGATGRADRANRRGGRGISRRRR